MQSSQEDLHATLKVGGAEVLSEDLSEGFRDLSAALAEVGITSEVDYQPPQGRGVTWYEVTLIYLGMKAADAVSGHVLDATIERISAAVVGWAKSRFRKDPDNRRPKSITVYGPDGNEIKTITVQSDGIVEEDGGG